MKLKNSKTDIEDKSYRLDEKNDGFRSERSIKTN